MHTLNQILHQVNKLSYLGQFEAEAIETWSAIQFYIQHTYGYKKVSFHGNPLLSSPLQPDFNICKQGHELDLTY